MTVKPTLNQLRRFVGNPEAYAQQLKDGTWRPVREPVTDEVLQSHLDLKRTIGTYIGHQVTAQTGSHGTFETSTVARTLCFDIDTGEVEDAKAIGRALEELGFPLSCAGIEFSGSKGYHVWLILQDYRPSHELRRVGRAVLALAPCSAEVYPRQDEVKDLGNLVKLPGGVHQVSGKTNDFLVKVPRPLPVSKWEEVLATLPEERARRTASESRFPCMTAIQEEGVTEGGRNIQLFHLATMLRRAGVSDENVDMVIRSTNDRCEPPLDDTELAILLESSKNAGPICSQLPEDRQCGELCIMARTSGLYTRPGQLRFAAEGENVVVTLVGRKGNTIEFSHDDVGLMKAVLRGN